MKVDVGPDYQRDKPTVGNRMGEIRGCDQPISNGGRLNTGASERSVLCIVVLAGLCKRIGDSVVCVIVAIVICLSRREVPHGRLVWRCAFALVGGTKTQDRRVQD